MSYNTKVISHPNTPEGRQAFEHEVSTIMELINDQAQLRVTPNTIPLIDRVVGQHIDKEVLIYVITWKIDVQTIPLQKGKGFAPPANS